MSFLKDKPQFPRGVADVPVEAVAPPPEYEIVIFLNDGSITRHDPEVVTSGPHHIHVKGPRKNEFTIYPLTSIAWYGKQEKPKIQSSNGKDAA